MCSRKQRKVLSEEEIKKRQKVRRETMRRYFQAHPEAREKRKQRLKTLRENMTPEERAVYLAKHAAYNLKHRKRKI